MQYLTIPTSFNVYIQRKLKLLLFLCSTGHGHSIKKPNHNIPPLSITKFWDTTQKTTINIVKHIVLKKERERERNLPCWTFPQVLLWPISATGLQPPQGHGMNHTCCWPFLWPTERKTNFPNLKNTTSCFSALEHAHKWSLRALPVILWAMSFTGLLG